SRLGALRSTLASKGNDVNSRRFENESYYADLRKPVLEATTINPETYTSTDFYEREQELLFAKSWQVVGYTEAFSTECVKNFNKKDYGLLPVRIDTFGPFVYANVSGDAPPLRTYLGDVTQSLHEYPFDELVSFKSTTVSVKCNWKLLAENFMEYYHLPAVHPQLCDVSGVDDHHRAQVSSSL
ncbi:hypothetical protein DYB32_000040, partial [Aphanomyces invadans]